MNAGHDGPYPQDRSRVPTLPSISASSLRTPLEKRRLADAGPPQPACDRNPILRFLQDPDDLVLADLGVRTTTPGADPRDALNRLPPGPE